MRILAARLVVCLAVGAALSGCVDGRQAPALLSVASNGYTWYDTFDAPAAFYEGEVTLDFEAYDGEVVIEAIEPVDLVGATFDGARVLGPERQMAGFDYLLDDPIEVGFAESAYNLPFVLSDYPPNTEMPPSAVMRFRIEDDADFVGRSGVAVTYTVDGARRTDVTELRFAICVDVPESTCEDLVADQMDVWRSM